MLKVFSVRCFAGKTRFIVYYNDKSRGKTSFGKGQIVVIAENESIAKKLALQKLQLQVENDKSEHNFNIERVVKKPFTSGELTNRRRRK